jgi:hypothetical protein
MEPTTSDAGLPTLRESLRLALLADSGDHTLVAEVAGAAVEHCAVGYSKHPPQVARRVVWLCPVPWIKPVAWTGVRVVGWRDDGSQRGRGRPGTHPAWAGRQLNAGERIIKTETLHGGLTAEMRRLTVAAPSGGIRHLVLRTFTDPYFVRHAEDLLNREANALALLAGTGVPAPAPVAVDRK